MASFSFMTYLHRVFETVTMIWHHIERKLSMFTFLMETCSTEQFKINYIPYTVEPPYNEGQRDRQSFLATFRFCYYQGPFSYTLLLVG